MVGCITTGDIQGHLIMWYSESGAIKQRTRLKFRQHPEAPISTSTSVAKERHPAITCLLYLQTRGILLAGSDNGIVYIMDGSNVRVLDSELWASGDGLQDGHDDPIAQVANSSPGSRLMTSASSGVTAIAADPLGQRLMLGDEKGHIRIWDVWNMRSGSPHATKVSLNHG